MYCVRVRVCACVCACARARACERENGWMDVIYVLYVCMYVCMYVWMDGWMDGCNICAVCICKSCDYERWTELAQDRV
jgi:hypothetical protein